MVSRLIVERSYYSAAALQSLKDSWQNVPPNWVGADPCGSSWDGIGCRNSRVVSM